LPAPPAISTLAPKLAPLSCLTSTRVTAITPLLRPSHSAHKPVPYLASGATAQQRIAASPRHGEWVAIKVGASDSVMAWVVYPERAPEGAGGDRDSRNTGLNIWTRSVADQLAAEGFIGIAPGPHHDGEDRIAHRRDTR
jgi:carboxymethylenebutenolidase